MSVISLLEQTEVREHLRKLRPKSPGKISVPLLASPLTRAYGLVGTAFDYAARFELQRRWPLARTEPWVAEASLLALRRRSADKTLAQKAERILAQAQRDVAAFTRNDNPSADDRAIVAAHAIRLAKLDTIYRIGYLDPNMGIAEPENVRDVLKLVEVAPFDKLGHANLWLNPTFGPFSQLVGGADCDLVSGNRLIEIKVTKNDALDTDYLLQLISYAILARGARKIDSAWPEVEELGVYFARHGYLWTTSAGEIYENPAYDSVEKWFLEHASQEFGGTVPRPGIFAGNGWPIAPGMTKEEIAFLEDDDMESVKSNRRTRH